MVLLKLVAIWISIWLTINRNVIYGQMAEAPTLSNLMSEFPMLNIKFTLTPPSTSNGAISSYLVIISTTTSNSTSNSKNCVIISLTCNNCINQTTGTGGTSINDTSGCESVYKETIEYNNSYVNLIVTSNSSGILPYTIYTIKAQAVDEWGWGNFSIIQSFLTSQYKSGPVEITNISDIFPQSTLLLTFKLPAKPNGNVNEYRVFITHMSTMYCDSYTIKCSNCTTNKTIPPKGDPLTGGLCRLITQEYKNIDTITINITHSSFIEAYKNYKIQIQSINEWGYGEILTKEYTTKEICLIKNFTCTNIGYTDINCKWHKPLMTNFEGYKFTCDLTRYYKIPSDKISVVLNYITDYHNYNCSIEVISNSNCLYYSSMVKVPMSPNGFPNHIPSTNYTDFMKDVGNLTADDTTSQIIINLPIHYFADRLDQTLKFTVVVARSSEQISLAGNISVKDFKDESYPNCVGKKNCVYEIVARESEGFSSIFSSETEQNTDRIFNIGKNFTSNIKHKNNGPLDANTLYYIGLRFYIDGRYGTVYTTMRTSMKPLIITNYVPIAVGLTISFLIILTAILVIWFNRNRLLYIIRGRDVTRQTNTNPYDGNDRDSGVYDNFELAPSEYDNPRPSEYDNVDLKPNKEYHNTNI